MTLNPDNIEDRYGMNAKRLLDFLCQHRLAAEASVSAQGGAQAAVVGIAVTDRFEIIFDTIDSSRKAVNLRQNPKLAIIIGGLTNSDQRTVQYEGVADEPTGGELERIKQVYYSVYPDGRSRLSWSGIIYVRVCPMWLHYSDYNLDPPQIVEFTPEQLVL